MKAEHEFKPTERKRSFKVTADSQGAFRVQYMNKYVIYYSEQEMLDSLPGYVETIKGWAEGLDEIHHR